MKKPRSWGILYGNGKLDPRAWQSRGEASDALSHQMEWTTRRNVKPIREAHVVPVVVSAFPRRRSD